MKNKQTPVRTLLDAFLPENTSPPSLSIGRCANDDGFDLRSFKHGRPSPLAANDCTGKIAKLSSKMPNWPNF